MTAPTDNPKTLEELELELQADLANALQYPRAILEKTGTAETKKAMSQIDRALRLVREYFAKFKVPT